MLQEQAGRIASRASYITEFAFHDEFHPEQTEDGRWKFVIQENGYLKDRTTVAGRAKHLEEIGQTQGGFYADPEKQELVKQRLEKYKNKQFKGI